MNCRPGDLAVFVRSTCGNEGRIVRCLRRAVGSDMERYGFSAHWAHRFVYWVIDAEVNCIGEFGDLTRVEMGDDEFLRPIRDPGEDAVDETLLWLPSPTKQGEPA
jgi:hypothetical protein